MFNRAKTKSWSKLKQEKKIEEITDIMCCVEVEGYEKPGINDYYFNGRTLRDPKRRWVRVIYKNKAVILREDWNPLTEKKHFDDVVVWMKERMLSYEYSFDLATGLYTAHIIDELGHPDFSVTSESCKDAILNALYNYEKQI